jgi:tRNA G18 (ribose-2'-O)-methylase SpoU
MRADEAILPIIAINDIDDPQISFYRSLKGRQLGREGIFIVEGPKAVKALLEGDIKVISCLTTKDFYKKFRTSLLKLAGKGIPVYLMSRESVGDVIGFNFHQGLMVACRIPKKISLESGIKSLKRPYLLAALNGVNDPENVGLIARNAAAFGASAMIVDEKTYDPYYRRAVRVSVGAIFKIPVFHVGRLAPELKRLKKSGVKVIVTHLGKKSKDIKDVDLSQDVCIIFGNEDKGVDRDVLAEADHAVKIPISGKVDSLNVASASAIILREAFMKKGQGSPARLASRGGTGRVRGPGEKAWKSLS